MLYAAVGMDIVQYDVDTENILNRREAETNEGVPGFGLVERGWRQSIPGFRHALGVENSRIPVTAAVL
jgi:hypothetical protein